MTAELEGTSRLSPSSTVLSPASSSPGCSRAPSCSSRDTTAWAQRKKGPAEAKQICLAAISAGGYTTPRVTGSFTGLPQAGRQPGRPLGCFLSPTAFREVCALSRPAGFLAAGKS